MFKPALEIKGLFKLIGYGPLSMETNMGAWDRNGSRVTEFALSFLHIWFLIQPRTNCPPISVSNQESIPQTCSQACLVEAGSSSLYFVPSWQKLKNTTGYTVSTLWVGQKILPMLPTRPQLPTHGPTNSQESIPIWIPPTDSKDDQLISENTPHGHIEK